MSIKILREDKTITECRVEASRVPPWKLIFSGIGMERREFEGDDLFEAMIALRKELERRGSLLLCAGACVDVFPSGMSRSMGAGRRAYRTRLGTPVTRTSDMVDIFVYAEPESVGSVEQQAQFHQRWIRSLRSTSELTTPYPGEIEEAKGNPNGWVYRMAGRFGPHEAVPPEAIVGAWKVDAYGNIVGSFIRNEKYDPKRWPA